MNFGHYDYAGSRYRNRRGQCRKLTVSKEREETKTQALQNKGND